jgi:hypothetical protein
LGGASQSLLADKKGGHAQPAAVRETIFSMGSMMAETTVAFSREEVDSFKTSSTSVHFMVCPLIESSVRHHSVKRTEFVWSSNLPLNAGSKRRLTARQIVSKLIEFVCPSSTRHRSAGSVWRSTARQIVSKLIEFVCPSSTRHRSAGSVWCSMARQIVSKLIEFVCPSSTRHWSAGSVRRSMVRQIFFHTTPISPQNSTSYSTSDLLNDEVLCT